ncbi:MAG TPA: SDR family oxidoreductase [Tepidisphaeraceae bacterium]|nr:SDR family oxidoreductase [Tepidisphaeraceae bacterium]
MSSTPTGYYGLTSMPPHTDVTASRGANWVVVVGASSGIGRAIANEWAASGNDIILAGRDLDDLNRSAADLRIRFGRQIEVTAFDALAFDTHEAFWRNCRELAPEGIAGVILLHGFLPVQLDAQTDLALMRQTVDTNLTSAISLLSLVSNDFERRGSGFICVFSSVAGDRGRQSNYVYGSAKAGLTAFLSGLRSRLFKSGVSVTTVKPGFVDTGMTWGLPGLFLVAQPRDVAYDVFQAVSKGRAHVYTPWFWQYIMLIIKSIPESVFKRMKL